MESMTYRIGGAGLSIVLKGAVAEKHRRLLATRKVRNQSLRGAVQRTAPSVKMVTIESPEDYNALVGIIHEDVAATRRRYEEVQIFLARLWNRLAKTVGEVEFDRFPLWSRLQALQREFAVAHVSALGGIIVRGTALKREINAAIEGASMVT